MQFMKETKTIPLREEIPAESKWAIEDLYPSDEAWEEALSSLTQDQAELEGFAGKSWC